VDLLQIHPFLGSEFEEISIGTCTNGDCGVVTLFLDFLYFVFVLEGENEGIANRT